MPSPRPRRLLALVLATHCAPDDPADPASDASSTGEPTSTATTDAATDWPSIMTTTEDPDTHGELDPLADPECTPAASEPCAYTGPAATDMVGTCRPATRTCDPDGRWGLCRGEQRPRTEDCSTAADEDCDGETTCTGTVEWVRSFGEPIGGAQGWTYIHSAAVDSQDRLWLTGSFTGSLRLGPTSWPDVSAETYFLARFGANGVPQFTHADRRAEASGRGTSIAIDRHDNVAVIADSTTTLQIAAGAPVRASETANRFTVVGLLDPQGAYRRDLRMTNLAAGWLSAYALTHDDAGNLWVAGDFSDSYIKLGTDVDAQVLENHGMRDGFVMKLRPDGTIAWAQRFGDANDQRIDDIAVDAAGDVWLIGTHRGMLKFQGGALVAPADDDAQFIVKLDGEGRWKWGSSYGGKGQQYFVQIEIDANGDAVVAGEYVAPTLDLGGHLLSKGDADEAMVVARYDTHGDVLWAQSWPCFEWCAIRSLAMDGAGQVVIATAMDAKATLTIDETVIHGESYENAAVLAKLDRTGAPVWPPRLHDARMQAAVTSTGAIYLSGTYKDSVSFGDFTVDAGPGDTDLYVARLRP